MNKLLLLIISFTLMLAGCKTAEQIRDKKDERAVIKISKIAASRPNALAKVCAKHFDNTSSVITNTEYVPGETVYETDTFTKDSIVYITRTIKATDTVRVKSTETVVNKAQEAYLQEMLDREKGDRVKEREKLNAEHNKEVSKQLVKNSKLEEKNKTLTQWVWRLGGALGLILIAAIIWLVIKYYRKIKIPI